MRLFVEAMRRYIAKYAPKLENNTSAFLWALAELLLDIAEIFLAVANDETNSDGQYDPSIPVATSGYINQAQGAFNKFLESVGAGV